MALYEYQCGSCGTRFEKRMPMSEFKAKLPCPKCRKQAQKVIGGVALVGVSQPSLGDGPAPWDDGGGMSSGDFDGLDMGGDFGDDDWD